MRQICRKPFVFETCIKCVTCSTFKVTLLQYCSIKDSLLSEQRVHVTASMPNVCKGSRRVLIRYTKCVAIETDVSMSM